VGTKLTPPPSPVRNITTDEKRRMQQALQTIGLYTDVVDGRWGANSLAAMQAWQALKGYKPADGIPTYQQMVQLGATIPEVIPRPRSKVGTGVLKLLLNVGLPLLLNNLPKVNLAMNNPLLLALGRINKAWVAAVVSFVSTYILLNFFGFELSADTQSLIVTASTAIITGLAAWLVPNAPPPPVQAAGLLQTSINNATPAELVEYSRTTWPDPVDAGDGVMQVPSEGPADGTTAGN
jgi:hypothetical protein